MRQYRATAPFQGALVVKDRPFVLLYEAERSKSPSCDAAAHLQFLADFDGEGPCTAMSVFDSCGDMQHC